MAQSSTVLKYTIRHEKEAAGSEVELPVYPTAVVPSNNYISHSWNTMRGQFREKLINRKVKINWTFDVMPEDKAVQLLETMINAKIDTYKTRNFYINTYMPGRGWIKGLFYLGTPDSISSVGGFSGKGKVGYTKAEIHWIEVDGNPY